MAIVEGLQETREMDDFEVSQVPNRFSVQLGDNARIMTFLQSASTWYMMFFCQACTSLYRSQHHNILQVVDHTGKIDVCKI